MPDDNQLSFKELIIKNLLAWTATQPFSNILLLVIALQISYAGYGMINHTLPSIHKTSKETLVELQKQHIDERTSILESHKKERKELIEFYDSWMRKAQLDKKQSNEVANNYGCN